MWMGMIRAQGMIGREIIEVVRKFTAEDLPGIAQMPGFLGTVLGQNLSRGSSFSAVFWETEEAMLEAERLYEQARANVERYFQQDNPYKNDSFKVIFATEVFTEAGGAATPHMHVSRFGDMTPEQTEQVARGVIDVGSRDFDVARGAEGAVVAANREAGTLAVITFWESERDMRATVKAHPSAVPGVPPPSTDSFEAAVTRDLDQLHEIEAASPSPFG